MKMILKTTLIAVLVAAIAGITAAGVVYAQGDDPPFFGRDGLAELLGLTPEELREQIHNGKTIEELAEEAGVDLETYQEEMSQYREDKMRTRIEEALGNGEISQDQAEWLLEGLDKGYLGGSFFQYGSRRPGGNGSRPNFDAKRGPGMRGGMFAE